jgi:ornithine cyclodeaminase/alanine dehydrogenase-like protein (mu-crystallin family)
MLFLKNKPVSEILSVAEMIEAIEEALKEMALGRGFELPRRRIHHPNRMIFGLLPGSVRGAMGAYLQTDLDRRIHHETIILYSVETGEPLMLFQDCAINESRTGAAGGIGAKHLALPDAATAGVIGSAVHAEAQLRALASVRKLNDVKVFSPTAAHRSAFAERMTRELGIPVHPAASAKEAIEGRQIIITATSSKQPVLEGNWLEPGVHITSIANGDKTRVRQELDERTLRRCDRIFLTSKETVCANESDIFRAVRDGIITWERIDEISSLLLGRVPGRTDPKEITLFKLQGTGLMDVALGLAAYDKIKDSGLAQKL